MIAIPLILETLRIDNITRSNIVREKEGKEINQKKSGRVGTSLFVVGGLYMRGVGMRIGEDRTWVAEQIWSWFFP